MSSSSTSILPGMTGSEGVCLLREKHPNLQVLMLTVYAEEDKIFESMCNGEIARKVVTLFQKTAPPDRMDENLTPP
jgi:DNA-binding NarL/FixJ family response regulator